MSATTYEPMTTACQCEHQDHFDHHDGQERCGHDYGQLFDIEDATRIRTIFGVFTVCVGCAERHFPKEVRAP